jgi:phosphonate transport system substrate-binding protein
MKRRNIIAAGAAAVARISLAQSRQDWVLAVADGVSYKSDPEADSKYAEIAATLGKQVGARVVVKKLTSYAELASGLAQGAYDLCYVHPGHHAIRAMTTGTYRLAALSKAHLGYRVNFFVRSDSPIQTFDQIAGARVLTPDRDSITAWMARAAIKDNPATTAKPPRLSETRFQEAVLFGVQNKLVDVGASASLARDAGLRTITSSARPVPVKHWLLRSSHITELTAVSNLLQSLPDTAKISAPQGFVSYDEKQLIALGPWIQRGSPV